MDKYILAIDQGTTGTTALLLNKNNRMVAESSLDYQQFYPAPGWVEHDLNLIWHTVEQTVTAVMKKSGISAQSISCIGITNQRETTCAYDSSGKPLSKAIVWQDRRTDEWCRQFKSRYQSLKNLTGLPLDPYFSATKMKWMLDHVPEVQKAAQNQTLHFSTIDTFLLFKLSSGAFFTEPSNASRTLLMSLETTNWHDDLLKFFGIDRNFLPAIKDTFGEFGRTKNLSFLPDGIPITCLVGDQQSALFGQGCLEPGDIKCTYGTGAFLLQQTGHNIIHSSQGLLTTVGYRLKGKTSYALEGSVYIAGASVQWLRDNLKIIENSSDIESLAMQVTNLEQMKFIHFLPFFSGIGTPHWQADAKAALVGLTRDTGNSHIARACLEGIALSINDCVDAFRRDFPKVNPIKVDGGATANNLLMQLQSNFSNQEIIRPSNKESTSMGAALGARVGLGEISTESIKEFYDLDRKFQPTSEDCPYYLEKKKSWGQWINRLYL